MLDMHSVGDKHNVTSQIVRRYAESLGVDVKYFAQVTQTDDMEKTFLALCIAQLMATKFV